MLLSTLKKTVNSNQDVSNQPPQTKQDFADGDSS